MVPTYKPAASFAFLKAWLRDEDYPIFDKNCTKPPSSTFYDKKGTMMDVIEAEIN